jgi:hypothetical protein
MVNTCEPVINDRNDKGAKVVVLRDRSSEIRLLPKWRCRSERGLNATASWTLNQPVDSGYLTSHNFNCGTWKPRTSLTSARALASGQAVRRADRRAGLRCRKKRRPCCNGADTGCNITGRESEPTSDGCLVARNLEKPLERENADVGAFGHLVRSLPSGTGGHKRVSRRSRRSIALAGSCESGLWRGLSRMR